MKPKWFIVFLLFTALLATTAHAQTQVQAQKGLDLLKSLAEEWKGEMNDGTSARVIFRTTGAGSAILNEIVTKDEGSMITMFHLDGERLLLTHYCGAGNQPRMKGTVSPDGKKITFEFLDITNLKNERAGHMRRLVINLLDADHHTEEWTYRENGRESTAIFNMRRSTV